MNSWNCVKISLKSIIITRLYCLKKPAEKDNLWAILRSNHHFISTVNINIQDRLHQTLHLGRKETLLLGVSAYPALTYEWTKDGQPVSFDARRTLDGRTGSITFSPVQLPDQGNYTCNVKNALSSHRYDPIRVQVIGKLSYASLHWLCLKWYKTEWFAIECCKIKTKVISLTGQLQHRQTA